MRKGIKIKTFTILLSWLMILAHSIIPHNHIDKCTTDYSGNLQVCIHHHEESNTSVIIRGQCKDINSCHISSLLFPHFNQDNLILYSNRDANISSVVLAGQIIFYTDRNFIIDNFSGSVSLRAPPAS